jgi:alkyl hydroperoxide reductase subunit D
MGFIEVRNSIPDFARDIRLTLESVLSEEGAPGLTAAQIWGVALATSYALGTPALIAATLSDGKCDDATNEASKSAAAIMAMNNVYYRSLHLLDDAELKKLPARLRMSVIGKPGIAKIDFELMCFAVSAIAGCGQCLTAHLHELRKAGIGHEGAQSVLRIASTLNAAAASLRIAAS